MALAVTRESLPSWATASAYLCRGHRCLLSTSHLAASLSPSGSQPQACVCSAWPHIAQIRHPTAWLGGPAHCRCSAPPGRVGRKAHSVNATQLGSCVCAALRSPRVLWARTGLGGPESQMSSEWWPTQWSRGPSFSCPTGYTAADAVSAPGPQVADGLPGHRRCGSQCQRASQHAHNWKTNILFLRCTFRPAHTQDGTCETTLLSAWREENSLPNKVKGPFQSIQGSGRGPGLTHCQDIRCVRGASTAAGLGTWKVGVRAPGETATWSWEPQRPQQGTGRQDCGALARPQVHPVPDTGFQREGILSGKMNKFFFFIRTSFYR